MAAVELRDQTAQVENNGGATIIVLAHMTCKGCEGEFSCEAAHLNCKTCVTNPDYFVSQR